MNIYLVLAEPNFIGLLTLLYKREHAITTGYTFRVKFRNVESMNQQFLLKYLQLSFIKGAIKR